jgi:hypothetical protein
MCVYLNDVQFTCNFAGLRMGAEARARQRTVEDNQLLEEIGMVLDSLYAHFSNNVEPACKQ